MCIRDSYIPGIGKLPIIGNFFKAHNARKSESELVIFLTPEVIDPATNTLSEHNQDFLFESEKRAVSARQSLPLME